MEWVETTGKTVEEALDAALDELGVDESDAEYEVVEEPKVGLFGRLRGEARVRARVRPTKPRPKEDRRDRKRRGSGGSGTGPGSAAAADADAGADAGGASDAAAAVPSEVAASGPTPTRAPARADRGRRAVATVEAEPATEHEERGTPMSETGVDVPVLEQGEVAAEFLRGLVDRFGLTATVAVRPVDEDTAEIAITGEDLGLLIGPKGTTLTALQDLARTVVQRRTSARNGRLWLDVSGYRERRREALAKFAESAAKTVLDSGKRAVLEPMSAADRKVIHDTINGIEGVTTTSEGEEPRRRVAILPASAASPDSSDS